jgi:hypothetical protein
VPIVRRFALPLCLALVACACSSPDPRQVLAIENLETYWAVDSSVGERVYIAPVARFTLVYKGQEPTRSVQATATFRRKGEEQREWGTAWEQVPAAGKALRPGDRVRVELKSDGRYYSTGEPASFFENELFKDAHVKVFLRIGSSSWVAFAAADVERRIGTKDLPQELRP